MRSADDAITVTTVVAIDPGAAFALFTDEVDAWWRREPRFRTGARPGVMRFEPGAGGRLVEIVDDAVVEIARVTAWEPPRRLVVAWHGSVRAVGAETEVEVRFEPEGGATRVTVEHRGWDAVPARHPMRGGLVGPAFASRISIWWAELANAMRARAAAATRSR